MSRPRIPQRPVVALLTAAVLCGAAIADAQQVVVLAGEDSYRPYTYADGDGNAVGLYAEILRAASDRLDDYEIELITLPWNRALVAVQRGEILGLYPPYRWTDQLPDIDRYSSTLLIETVVAICRRDRIRPHQSVWPDDFHGLTIGNVDGYLSAGPDFFSAVARGQITMQLAASTEANLRSLLIGRIDCYVSSRSAIDHAWKLIGVDDARSLGIVEAAVVANYSGHIGYTANADAFPYKDDFADRLDAVLEEMHRAGDIDAIVDNSHLP